VIHFTTMNGNKELEALGLLGHLATTSYRVFQPNVSIIYIFYHIQLALWDTAGLERTNSLGKAYFHEARAVLLVYNMKNETTAMELQHWAEEATEKVNRKPLYFVIGTHSDKVDHAERDSIKQKLEHRLSDYEIEMYFEVSNENGRGFDECIKTIVRALTRERGVLPDPNPYTKPVCDC